MNIKEYLNKPFELYKTILKKENLLVYYNRMSLSVGGPSYGEEYIKQPRDPFYNPATFWLYKALDLEKEIDEDLKVLKSLQDEVNAKIQTLDDMGEKLILSLRYICFREWKEIISESNYSESHMFKKHRDAIKKLELKIIVDNSK